MPFMSCTSPRARDRSANSGKHLIWSTMILGTAPMGPSWFVRLSMRPCIPLMRHSRFPDQPADHDDTVRGAEHGIIDPDLALGADLQFLEAAVVPRIGSFHHPVDSGPQGFALGADFPIATQLGEQVPGLGAVIASIQVRGDLLWPSVAETGKAFEGGTQQRGVIPVRARGNAADRDAFPVRHQRALGDLHVAVHWGFPNGFAAVGCFDHVAIDDEVLQGPVR